jgi:hypothetical protein
MVVSFIMFFFVVAVEFGILVICFRVVNFFSVPRTLNPGSAYCLQTRRHSHFGMMLITHQLLTILSWIRYLKLTLSLVFMIDPRIVVFRELGDSKNCILNVQTIRLIRQKWPT